MKLSTRTRLNMFKRRLKIAWQLLFKKKHFVVIILTEGQFVEMIAGRPIQTMDIAFAGMMQHHAGQVIKQTAPLISDIDLLCAKSEYEATVEEQQRKKGRV